MGLFLAIRNTIICKLNLAQAKELHNLGLLRQTALKSTPTTAAHPQRNCRRRCERRQKRGKCKGIRARLAANPHKLAIPFIVLAKVRSSDNKLDYIHPLKYPADSERVLCFCFYGNMAQQQHNGLCNNDIDKALSELYSTISDCVSSVVPTH